MVEKIERELADGYRRIKLKIKPGLDIQIAETARERFPDTPIMLDANSAYTLADMQILKDLDRFDLMMIEQPLADDDLIDHAALQKQIKTPVCLDESIPSVEFARQAHEIDACKIINIKLGRVGGHTEASRIHRYCLEKSIPVWCGGMLETGIGRAHNIALSTLPGFSLPGDVSASKRYWKQDIIEPEVTVDKNGRIKAPAGPGIGYEVNQSLIDKLTLRRELVKF
jgi:O-succinylbenzoate synthase